MKGYSLKSERELSPFDVRFGVDAGGLILMALLYEGHMIFCLGGVGVRASM